MTLNHSSLLVNFKIARKIFVCLFAFIPINVFSQIPQLPQAALSPNAASLGMYGDIPVVIQAQNTLRSELNLPRVDDQLVKEQVYYRQAGIGGENIFWDFSKLRWADDYIVNYFSRDDWGMIGAENGNLFSYRYSGDSLLLQGYENPNHLVRYQKSGLLLKFPLEYGVSSEGYLPMV